MEDDSSNNTQCIEKRRYHVFSFHSRLPIRLLTGATAVALALCTAGCDNANVGGPASIGGAQIPSLAPTSSSSSASPSGAAQAAQPHLTDYSHLLLQAGDLNDSEDTFAPRSSNPTPNGVPGASTLFVNADDTRAVSLTVAVYPGVPTTTATLHQAVNTSDTVVSDSTTQPLAVGGDGTMIKGRSPDGSKAVTLALFTTGNALARLEFDSAPNDPTTDQFVTKVAKMQQIALRVGIPDNSE